MKLISTLLLIGTFLFTNQIKFGKEKLLNQYDQNNIIYLTKEYELDFNIEFKKQITFSSNQEVIVGDVTAMAVDDNDNVFIADKTQTIIHVFLKDGSYLKSLGRKGKGPGDFSGLTFNTTMTIFSNKLFVTDTFLYFPHRANVFSLEDLAFSHTLNLIPENLSDYKTLKGYFPKQIIQQNDNKFLVSYHQSPNIYKDGESFIYYVLVNNKNNIVANPILKQKDRKNLTYFVEDEYPYLAIRSFPFFGRSLFAASKDGYLYFARSEEFKIDVYDSKGNFMYSFMHPFENKIFSKRKTIDQYIEMDYGSEFGDEVAIKMLENAKNLPKTWPALDNMFIDDENRIWVSTVVEDTEIYEWWILETSGELINKFEWPRDKPIQTVRNNKLYTIEENPKTFEKEVVQYQILMNE